MKLDWKRIIITTAITVAVVLFWSLCVVPMIMLRKQTQGDGSPTLPTTKGRLTLTGTFSKPKPPPFNKENPMSYTRYRFKTNSVDDPRPLKPLKPLGVPYWITGYEQDEDHNFTAAIIVCYLPTGTDLLTYWDDAHEVESTEADEITYSSHFPKPEWLK